MATTLTPARTKKVEQLWRLLLSRRVTPFYYLLPTIIPVLVLTLYPFLRSVSLAFTEYDLYKKDATFTGIDNFVALATQDQVFWVAMRNNFVWTIGIVTLAYVLGLLTALALNEALPMKGMFRAVVLIPWVCPPVVAALTWRLIYDTNFGFLNSVLIQLNLIQGRINWLRADIAMYSAILMAVWKLLPFTIVMLLAGLQAVPSELYEAAAIDGAGAWQRLRYITLPLLNRVGSIALLLSTIWAFNHFDSMYVLTAGGPGNRTMLLSIMAYKYAFSYFQIGYASAIGVVMFIAILIPLVLYIRWLLQEYE